VRISVERKEGDAGDPTLRCASSLFYNGLIDILQLISVVVKILDLVIDQSIIFREYRPLPHLLPASSVEEETVPNEF
jgi:hypothetical protein